MANTWLQLISKEVGPYALVDWETGDVRFHEAAAGVDGILIAAYDGDPLIRLDGVTYVTEQTMRKIKPDDAKWQAEIDFAKAGVAKFLETYKVETAKH